MRILVTGSTGLVGNNCVRVLREHGHDVVVIVREGYSPRSLEGLDLEIQVADLLTLRADAVPKVNAIIHAAADTHIGCASRPTQTELNVGSTRVLAGCARETGAKLVFVSSVDALPAASRDTTVNEESSGPAKYACGYVLSKRQAELEVRQGVERGLSAVIVNPGFMLGPWDWKPSSGRMLLRVATGFTPFGPKGGFSVCDVRDVAKAIVRVATSETAHNQYILAGHNVRYVEAWRQFAQVTTARGPICSAGPLMRVIAGKWGDLCTKVTGREDDVNSAAIKMSDLYHYYDSCRAQQELGYQLRPIAESVADAWHWFRQYGYAP